MANYRVYTIGDDGHFINSRGFSCDNDPDAIVWAKQLVDGHDIELRSGARLIIRLERKPNPFFPRDVVPNQTPDIIQA